MLCQAVVGKERTQLLPPKAIWYRAQPVIFFRTDPIQEGAGPCLSRTLPHFLGGTAWKLVAGQTQLIKRCNYISFGNANIYIK